MNDAEIQLQNALTTTFLANLVFLSEYDNELFQRVDELSQMIGDGRYKEKYALEFIMESGDFDIYDLVNNKYLYNKDPKKFNEKLIKDIKFNEKNVIFDLPAYFRYKDKAKLDSKNKFDYQHLQEFSTSTQHDMCDYANILGDYLVNSNKKLKKINNFIFLGTLLGRHIPKIAEKIDAKSYLVLEKNLEIFRLSLFTVDYTILAKNGVIFSVMDENIVTEKKIKKYINQVNMFDNYLLKFSTTNINIDEYIDLIITCLCSRNPTSYDYHRQLYCLVNRSTKVLKSYYKTILFNKVIDKCDFFTDIPVLYIAGGPSLDENIAWIKKNQDKFFIVTIGAVYKKLLNNDIKIDMITTLDESSTFDKIQFDDESVRRISKKTIILASSITNENVMKKLNQKKLFLYETMSSFHDQNISFSGYSIGEVTLDILLKMNVKELYLIGLDLALNQKTGLSHAEGANTGVYRVNLNISRNKKTFHHKNDFVKVKGNLQEKVFTTSIFYSSIKSVEHKLHDVKDTNVYNLSMHGAFFEKTIPLKVEDLEISNFSEINYEIDTLNKFLKKYSTNKLSFKSKKIIKEEIGLVGKIIDDLTLLKEIKLKKFDNFLEEVMNILKKIVERGLSSFREMFINYLLNLIPYLKYHFNDKNIRAESKKISEIKKVFLDQTHNLLNDYKTCLERLV